MFQTWSFVDPDCTSVVLGFGPRLNPTDFCGFFILGTCWGQFSQKGDEQLQNGTAQVTSDIYCTSSLLYLYLRSPFQ